MKNNLYPYPLQKEKKLAHIYFVFYRIQYELNKRIEDDINNPYLYEILKIFLIWVFKQTQFQGHRVAELHA